MTADLKPYPEYKDSGLSWLGEIPKHWDVRRGKSVFKCIDKRSKNGDEELLTVSSKDGVVPRREKAVTMFMAESYEGYKLCWPGDLVINSLWAWAGGLGFSRFHGIISSAYGVYRPLEEFSDNWKYLDYLLRSKVYDWEFHVRSKGIWVSRLQLTDESFLDMPIVLPKNHEAIAIAQFLTGASAHINRLIRTKWRLIELLKEQKGVIIHSAVTRGLDPNVSLKPSGIEWLGDIPMHWEMRRIKAVARFVTSGSRDWAKYYSDTGPIFLRIGNISTTSVDLKLNRITHVLPPIDAEGERTRVQEDDVLLSITAQIGAVGIVPSGFGEAYVNQHTALIRLKPVECHQRWVAYCLLSEFGKRQCQLLTNGGTKVGLTLDDVRTIWVLIPPKSEQEIIVGHIEALTHDLNTAISRTEREIALLREYRTRLVADVVTGKLDVSGVEFPTMDKEEVFENIDIIEDNETEDLTDFYEVTNNDE